MSSYWNLRSSRFPRRRFVRGTAVTSLGAAAILAGCGDDDDDGPGTTQPTTSPTQAGQTPTSPAAGKAGGTFRISMQDASRGLDPAINTLNPTFHSARNYSRTHAFQLSAQAAVLDMATSIEQPDAQTIVYTIRPDIKFHDVSPMDGRLATAEDLAYSWQRFANVGTMGSTLNAAGWRFLDLPALSTPDATTVDVKLTAPAADALAIMGQHFYAVVAREVVEANAGNLSQVKTAGTGPYILDEFVADQRLVWRRNPDYFSHDHSDQRWFPADGPYFDAFESAVINDPGTLQARLTAGDLDGLYVNALTVDRVLAQQFESSGLQVVEGRANDHVGLGMVMDRLADTRLRQAITKALQYDTFIEAVYLGDGRLGAPVGGGFPDSVRLPETELEGFMTRNATEARQLWEAANGPSELIILTITPYPFMEQAVLIVKQGLEDALGITVNVEAYDIPSWLARVTDTEPKSHDLYVFFDRSLPDAPSTNALSAYNAAGTTLNTLRLRPDSEVPAVAALANEMLALYRAQDEALTPEERTEPLHEMQRFILENAVPAVPLPVIRTQYMVASSRVQGLDTMKDDVTFWNNHLTNNLYLDPPSP